MEVSEWVGHKDTSYHIGDHTTWTLSKLSYGLKLYFSGCSRLDSPKNSELLILLTKILHHYDIIYINAETGVEFVTNNQLTHV